MYLGLLFCELKLLFHVLQERVSALFTQRVVDLVCSMYISILKIILLKKI